MKTPQVPFVFLLELYLRYLHALEILLHTDYQAHPTLSISSSS